MDAKHTVRLEDGARALHPVIRHHGPAQRSEFRERARCCCWTPMPIWESIGNFSARPFADFTLPAIRQAHVTQVSDVAKWLASNRAACGGKKVREGDRIVARIV